MMKRCNLNVHQFANRRYPMLFRIIISDNSSLEK